MITRVLVALRLGRWLPRCRALPPWRLADADVCCLPRNHASLHRDGAEWHADGQGYIWDDTRWGWRGPVVSLADLYPQGDATGYVRPVWTERL